MDKLCIFNGQGCSHEDTCRLDDTSCLECGYYKYFIYLLSRRTTMSETTDIKFKGFEFHVEFEYTPYCQGARERSTGVPLEPDSLEDVEEIISVTTSQNIVELLDDNFIADLSAAILEAKNEPLDDGY